LQAALALAWHGIGRYGDDRDMGTGRGFMGTDDGRGVVAIHLGI